MDNIMNKPVDVICYGTREHFDTRQEAINKYAEAIGACEGSEQERYTKIYFALAHGSADIVTDGSSERVENEPSVKFTVDDKDKIISLINADDLTVLSLEIYDRGECKLVAEDRDIIKALLKKDGWYAAQFLRKYIENDKELIMAVALGGEEPGRALPYASEQLRDDKKFVLELIKIDPSDIQFVSDRLSNDIDVVSTALKHAETNYDIESIKENLGTALLSDMVNAYLEKQQEKDIGKGITAKFDFSKVPQEKMDEYYVEVFDTAEAMFNDLYLYDADYQTLRDAIHVLKNQDMHSAVVEHMNVRYDGEKYYYSSEMEEFERVVLENQKPPLENLISEAKGGKPRDNEDRGTGSKTNEKDKGFER